jgi:hypothetical protein
MNNGALAIAISVHWILVRPRRSNYHQFKTYECHKTIYTLYSFLVLLLKAISSNSDFFNVESNWSSSFSNQSISRSFRIILLNGFEFSVSSECHVALSITIAIRRLRPYFKTKTFEIRIRIKLTVILPETKSCLFEPFDKMSWCHGMIFWTVRNFYRGQVNSTRIDHSRYSQTSIYIDKCIDIMSNRTLSFLYFPRLSIQIDLFFSPVFTHVSSWNIIKAPALRSSSSFGK